MEGWRDERREREGRRRKEASEKPDGREKEKKEGEVGMSMGEESELVRSEREPKNLKGGWNNLRTREVTQEE